MYASRSSICSGVRENCGISTAPCRANRLFNINTGSHLWGHVGVDSSRIFEYYAGSTLMKLWVVGYFTSDAVFFDNAVDKSLSSTSAWTDIDISSDTGADTAIGAYFEMTKTAQTQGWGFRKNGSTDNRPEDGSNQRHIWIAIGVDGSEICEGFIESTSTDFYLNGHQKKRCDVQHEPQQSGADER